MVIKVFIYVLFSIATIIYFIPVSNEKQEVEEKDLALLTFNNSTMYTLNEDTTTRIVNSRRVVRYKNRDVMFDGEIVLKANDKKVKNATDIISANIIIKKGEDYTFLTDVKYRRDNFISLNTQELFYNGITKIGKNSVPFDGYYYNHFVKGTNLYVDTLTSEMKSKNAHFEIETIKN